jgi:hypothetical protein
MFPAPSPSWPMSPRLPHILVVEKMAVVLSPPEEIVPDE